MGERFSFFSFLLKIKQVNTMQAGVCPRSRWWGGECFEAISIAGHNTASVQPPHRSLNRNSTCSDFAGQLSGQQDRQEVGQ